MKLLLFDIDGTLVRTNGVGRSSVERAFAERLGGPIRTDAVTFSGKTDPQIIREILIANDVDATDDLVDEVLALYEETAYHTLQPNHVELLPGTAALLDGLARRSDVQLGLLTGNVRRMAYRKLDAVGLGKYFPFGAFGSDHADRYQLPSIGLARARAHATHPFEGDDMVIIGDTEHDIRCGRSLGATSVAVCTGRYTRADLAPHDPDILFDDLSDVEAFFVHVLGAL